MSHSHHPDTHFESRMELRRRVAARLLVGVLILAVLLAAGYLGFVRTNAGQAFDNAAYAGRPKFSGELATLDADILGEVSKPALLIALSCVVVVSLLLRCPLVGIVAAVAAGAAVLGAEFFKHTLPRPMLSPVTVPVPGYFVGDTYPSGHTTIGSSVAFAFIMIAGPRVRSWIAILAGAMSASFATAVFFMGWHRPSDALGGIAWSGFCMGAAALALVLLHGHHARPGRRSVFVLNVASQRPSSCCLAAPLSIVRVRSISRSSESPAPSSRLDLPFRRGWPSFSRRSRGGRRCGTRTNDDPCRFATGE